MEPYRFIEIARSNKIIAIVRSDDPTRAKTTAQSLIERGVTMIELTMTTPGAFDLLRRVKGAGTVTAVGMGTVLSAPEASEAIAAGADFIVSPIHDSGVVDETRSRARTMISGVLTPSEVQRAHQSGADVVKLFPAGDLGVGYFTSLHTIFPQIPMIPTGSIAVADVHKYLDVGALAVGLGGALTRGTLAEMDGRVSYLRSLASG